MLLVRGAAALPANALAAAQRARMDATLTADANLFYSQQPPPYNAGTSPI